jgi:hypothetical protein
MLPVSWDTIRLFLHVLAATIWVGGQATLGPPWCRCCAAWARRFPGPSPAALARLPGPRGTAGLAVFGALTGISALAALFLGILLAG